MKNHHSWNRWHRAAAATLTALLLVGSLCHSHAQATANPPDRMAYQGFLLDANGIPLANSAPGNFPIRFRIYDASSAGTIRWAEDQIVTVDKGNFSVVLGEGTPVGGEPGSPGTTLSMVFSGANASDRYLETTVTIGPAPTTLVPRLRLLPGAYAFLARNATALVQPNGSNAVTVANGSITVNGTLNGTVSGTVSGNGSGLTSLNGSQITSGTVPDGQLSANIARRNTANNFVGAQSVQGAVGTDNVFGFSNSQQGPSPYGTYLSSPVSSTMVFFTANAERLRISSVGNVGVGQQNPTNKLHVAGGVTGDSLVLANNAPAAPSTFGRYFKDNSIVAWGKIVAAGTHDANITFGIASVTKPQTGVYNITTSAPATVDSTLIPMAIAEVDGTPFTAASARLVAINQTGVNTFSVYISNGSYAATDNDFLFIVTGR